MISPKYLFRASVQAPPLRFFAVSKICDHHLHEKLVVIEHYDGAKLNPQERSSYGPERRFSTQIRFYNQKITLL
jgi:hypothetical protein